MDARSLFLMGHAHTHSSRPSPDKPTTREDGLCAGLTEAELSLCPSDCHNSIAWLLWHMARCEDVMVNTVLRNVPEVLDDGWLNRLGVTTRHIGTGDTMAEVRAFSQQVDVTALRLYRAAVGKATQTWAQEVDFSSLDRVLKPAGAERAAQRSAFGERADWVRVMWCAEERTELWYLSWLAIGHNHSHLGEGWVTRGMIGRAGR